MTVTFIIVTLLVLRTQSVSAVFCPAVFFYNSQALNCFASYEKSEQVQSANVFKRQTLTFCFAMYCPNSFNIYAITRRSGCMRESTAAIIVSK